ncbi:MAG: hypothetical protein ACEPOV_02880 [Hyphomicrobiales bacterium]
MNKTTRSYNKLLLNKTLVSKVGVVSHENKTSTIITTLTVTTFSHGKC